MPRITRAGGLEEGNLGHTLQRVLPALSLSPPCVCIHSLIMNTRNNKKDFELKKTENEVFEDLQFTSHRDIQSIPTKPLAYSFGGA